MRKIQHCSKFAIILALLTASTAFGTPSPLIVVNSTSDTAADDGHCTLREAITAATNNAPSGAMPGECAAGAAFPAIDHIQFAIPPSDSGCKGSPVVCTIKPATNLPTISGGPAFIDGYTQAGASPNTLAVGDNAVLTIELDATNLSPALMVVGSFNGSVSGSGSTIRGLAVTHVGGTGLCASCSFSVDASNVTIAGNFVGTDVTGTATTSAGGNMIYIVTSSNVRIGGTDPADRNVVATTNGSGISVQTSSLPVVQGNYIGIDASGTQALNAFYGIDVENSPGALIGGGTTGAGNVIGAHGNIGIQLNGAGSSNSVIQGNYIGTNATGTAAVAGAGIGILLGTGADDTGVKIGGAGAGEGNLISGNSGNGIVVAGAANGVAIQGNRIGTDVTGLLAVPNGGCGIEVDSANAGTIGGTAAGEGNIIAFNNTNGVAVFGSATTAYAILGNTIHDNASLGISFIGRCNDLSTGPAPNDVHDTDEGPNALQNYPDITAATIAAGGTSAAVSGTLDSTANTTFRIEFFANARCDDGNPLAGTGLHTGEGKVYLGFADVTTIGNSGAFSLPALAVPRQRHVITATATDPAGRTSEFAVCSTQDTIFTDGLEND